MYLGIDIGTSGIKAVLVDGDGTVVDQSHADLTVQRPHPLWSEQNPSDWWAATNRAVNALDAGLRADVLAVGLSGQMHGATLIGEDGKAVRPALLWNDGRSLVECAELEERVPDLRTITGNCAMPGFTAPKVEWVRKHEPEAFAATKKIILPKDYIRLRMTGEYASDMSDSAGTLWLDTAKRGWSKTMLEACGLTEGHMPTLYEGNEFTGILRAELAEAWGMQRVSVAAGAGDNAGGAIGSGIYKKGEAFLSLGTSGVIFLADNSYRPNPNGGVHTFCHALPNRWHQMAVQLSAASAVDWVAKTAGFADPTGLYTQVAERGEPTSTEYFLPYLSGERTPHNNPLAQGVFFGMTHETDSVAMGQAALEGVAFGLADGIDALKDAGAHIDTLSVIGGGARSSYWGKILASTFGLPLIYRDGGTVGPAYGAARLARLAHTGEAPEDVCTPPKIIDIIEPDETLSELYAQKRVTFKRLYSSLSDIFTENQP